MYGRSSVTIRFSIDAVSEGTVTGKSTPSYPKPSHQSVLVQLVRGHEPLGETLVHEQPLHVQHLAAPSRDPSPAALPPSAEVSGERADRLGHLFPVKLDLHLCAGVSCDVVSCGAVPFCVLWCDVVVES